MFKALTILIGLLLLGWALGEQKQYTGSRKLRERPTFYAWCAWRDGKDCTNTASPVFG
jgi:hypothetical protein